MRELKLLGSSAHKYLVLLCVIRHASFLEKGRVPFLRVSCYTKAIDERIKDYEKNAFAHDFNGYVCFAAFCVRSRRSKLQQPVIHTSDIFIHGDHNDRHLRPAGHSA